MASGLRGFSLPWQHLWRGVSDSRLFTPLSYPVWTAESGPGQNAGVSVSPVGMTSVERPVCRGQERRDAPRQGIRNASGRITVSKRELLELFLSKPEKNFPYYLEGNSGAFHLPKSISSNKFLCFSLSVFLLHQEGILWTEERWSKSYLSAEMRVLFSAEPMRSNSCISFLKDQ